ncbi:MAG: hypothetical protein B6I24_06815 [Bacteroidetes bacterium 4572_128]|nr:MAG: hypothetical protein B6I24_06815 [Bacteroidetes bacterium 4572_128]
MEIYRDKYISYFYEEENSLIVFYWSKDTEYMSDEDYKKLMLKGLSFAKKYNPKYVINNTIEKKYITTVENQEWIAKNVLSKIFQNGVIKFAVIESEDIIIQISTEQATEEHEEPKYSVMFFEKEEEAREWFKK